MPAEVPPYLDRMLAEFGRGTIGRHIHLGHWEHPVRFTAAHPPGDGEFERAQSSLNQVLLEMADLGDGMHVLDVGCGLGATLQAIDQRHAGMELVGVNHDPRQLEICRQLSPSRNNEMRWVHADACHLGLPEPSFDRVFCVEAMFHFSSRRRFFESLAGLLRPGGVFVFSDILIEASAARLHVPRFCIEGPIRDAFGPWPDFWGQDADHRSIGAACGFVCTQSIDGTENTRPSHAFTAPEDLNQPDPVDRSMRGAMMLKWLHENGHLRYVYMRFDKPFPPSAGIHPR